MCCLISTAMSNRKRVLLHCMCVPSLLCVCVCVIKLRAHTQIMFFSAVVYSPSFCVLISCFSGSYIFVPYLTGCLTGNEVHCGTMRTCLLKTQTSRVPSSSASSSDTSSPSLSRLHQVCFFSLLQGFNTLKVSNICMRISSCS